MRLEKKFRRWTIFIIKILPIFLLAIFLLTVGNHSAMAFNDVLTTLSNALPLGFISDLISTLLGYFITTETAFSLLLCLLVQWFILVDFMHIIYAIFLFFNDLALQLVERGERK